jgi:hypothetical protein
MSNVTTIPKFNPSKDERVDAIKNKTEELIKYIQSLEGVDERRKAIALTNYEQAAMWAVKACFP